MSAMTDTKPKVGILTAGGLAPCLSSSIGFLIKKYTTIDPTIDIICYKCGYKGLLIGDSITVTPEVRANAMTLTHHGGSPIGNSRVKLTNAADCVKKGFVKEGDVPLEVAAKQLVKDGVTILHTIGGDDTNTQAAELSKYLETHSYKLTVVGLPKTIDNDVFPIRQSLGAWTAAEHGAEFFANVVSEHSANPRMLIIHECMGRDCGYLTAATAYRYREMLYKHAFVPGLGHTPDHKDVHAVYMPEQKLDIEKEAARLKAKMDELDNVSIFISEGACAKDIVAEMEARGEEVPRDAFGHVKLDKVNPGEWFAKQFAAKIGAEKVMVQKSGYYARAAAPNAEDRALILKCAELGVDSALAGVSGCVGEDEDQGNTLRAIEFPRIKGGKHFNLATPWYVAMMGEIGQPTA